MSSWDIENSKTSERWRKLRTQDVKRYGITSKSCEREVVPGRYWKKNQKTYCYGKVNIQKTAILRVNEFFNSFLFETQRLYFHRALLNGHYTTVCHSLLEILFFLRPTNSSLRLIQPWQSFKCTVWFYQNTQFNFLSPVSIHSNFQLTH